MDANPSGPALRPAKGVGIIERCKKVKIHLSSPLSELARKLLGVTVVALVAVSLGIAFIWAPMVPFERLVGVNAPTTPDLCPGSQICQVTTYNVWARSYGSLAYDFFGYGTAPFTGPVSVEKNGVVTEMTFNSTSASYPTNSVEYPVSSPEPFPLLRVNGLTVYPHGAPFGGAVTQISVTNLGVGETVEVSWGNTAGSQLVPAGATVLLNSTDWTGGPLPAAYSNYTISLVSSVHYPKLWLYATTTQAVPVTYSS